MSTRISIELNSWVTLQVRIRRVIRWFLMICEKIATSIAFKFMLKRAFVMHFLWGINESWRLQTVRTICWFLTFFFEIAINIVMKWEKDLFCTYSRNKLMQIYAFGRFPAFIKRTIDWFIYISRILITVWICNLFFPTFVFRICYINTRKQQEKCLFCL